MIPKEDEECVQQGGDKYLGSGHGHGQPTQGYQQEQEQLSQGVWVQLHI